MDNTGTGHAPPTRDPRGSSAVHGSRTRPGYRRRRAPGRCSPVPVPRPCATHCGGSDMLDRPGTRWTRAGRSRRWFPFDFLPWGGGGQTGCRSAVDEHAAVHVDDGARDVGGQVGSEEQIDPVDVLGVAEPPERNALDYLLAHLVGELAA